MGSRNSHHPEGDSLYPTCYIMPTSVTVCCMSKAVRIREHLYEQIELLAKQERRSLIGQLEVLLEQALSLVDTPITRVEPNEDGSATARVTSTPRQDMRESDAHFKPDFKK